MFGLEFVLEFCFFYAVMWKFISEQVAKGKFSPTHQLIWIYAAPEITWQEFRDTLLQLGITRHIDLALLPFGA